MIAALIAPVLLLIEGVALYCAWRALQDTRTSQGALGWVIFLLVFPFLGIPLWLFLGHHRYRGYIVDRRESQRIAARVDAFGDRHKPETTPKIDPAPFEAIADLPVVRGNDVDILTDNTTFFDRMHAAIDAARKYVLVQFYIVRDDATGQALADRLIAAADRGVTVLFLVDPVGSYGLSQRFYERLEKGGVRVVHPGAQRGPTRRFQLNFRNHRKTVVIDGITGFTGGYNIGDEYTGPSDDYADWRDTHLELRGPVVVQLQLVFAEDWHWASRERIFDQLFWDDTWEEADRTALLVPTGPGDPFETGALVFFAAIVAAKKRLWIASPYCVPDTDVLTALKHAALSGVEVRLLVPDVKDHLLPWLAAFAYFDELREAGVEIWRYNAGFMHQKVVLVDDSLAMIGTTNLDNRSFRLNFEAMTLFFDPEIAARTGGFLADDFSRAFKLERSLSEQPWTIRVGAPVARLFSPVL